MIKHLPGIRSLLFGASLFIVSYVGDLVLFAHPFTVR